MEEKDQCRSLAKTIGLQYARDQLLRAQELLERFRLCECPELAGFECQCLSDEAKEALRNKVFTDKSVQTEETNGESFIKSLHITQTCRFINLDIYSLCTLGVARVSSKILNRINFNCNIWPQSTRKV